MFKVERKDKSAILEWTYTLLRLLVGDPGGKKVSQVIVCRFICVSLDLVFKAFVFCSRYAWNLLRYLAFGFGSES